MTRIIATCFEPFGGDDKNSSYEAVMSLKNEYGGAEVVKVLLPVVYGDCFAVLEEKIKEYTPKAVLCFGQAASRKEITVETAAVNMITSAVADNSGIVSSGEIIPGGKAELYSGIPSAGIVSALMETGIPASLSYSAGGYVCNDLMYLMLSNSDKYGYSGGFVHLPSLDATNAGTLKKGAEICVREVIKSLS